MESKGLPAHVPLLMLWSGNPEHGPAGACESTPTVKYRDNTRSCRPPGAETCPSLRIATCSQAHTPQELQAEQAAKRQRSEQLYHAAEGCDQGGPSLSYKPSSSSGVPKVAFALTAGTPCRRAQRPSQGSM